MTSLIVIALTLSTPGTVREPAPPLHPGDGDFVQKQHLLELDCLEDAEQLCAVEQQAYSEVLYIRGSRGFFSSIRSCGMTDAQIVFRLDGYSNGRWRGREAPCSFEDCRPDDEFLMKLPDFSKPVPFESTPFFLWRSGDGVVVRKLEPRCVEDWQLSPRLVEYVKRSDFEAKLNRLRKLLKPRDCADGPPQAKLRSYVRQGRACMDLPR